MKESLGTESADGMSFVAFLPCPLPVMFKDRLGEFLQREFDTRVNGLLAGSQKLTCVSFSLTMVSFAYPAANSSGVLHAQILKGCPRPSLDGAWCCSNSGGAHWTPS